MVSHGLLHKSLPVFKSVFYVMKGWRREFLTEYQEFMWRDKFDAGQSTFEVLCGHIALIHRV